MRERLDLMEQREQLQTTWEYNAPRSKLIMRYQMSPQYQTLQQLCLQVQNFIFLLDLTERVNQEVDTWKFDKTSAQVKNARLVRYVLKDPRQWREQTSKSSVMKKLRRACLEGKASLDQAESNAIGDENKLAQYIYQHIGWTTNQKVRIMKSILLGTGLAEPGDFMA